MPPDQDRPLRSTEATSGPTPAPGARPELVLLGPPGSGKGTHARAVAQRYSVPHISTGALLRREIDAQTQLGRDVAETVRSGALVGDRTIVTLLDQELRSERASRGWVLDGAPRTVSQATMLAPVIEEQDPVIVIALDVDEDELRRRLTQRRDDEQRSDDAPQVVEDRLALWARTGPQLLDRYARGGLLVRVDGIGTIAEVSARVLTAIENAIGDRSPT